MVSAAGGDDAAWGWVELSHPFPEETSDARATQVTGGTDLAGIR